MTSSMAIDGTVVAILLCMGLAGFWPVFGGSGFLRPALVGLVVGAVVAWLGYWRKWATITVAVAVVVAYFLFATVGALWTRGVLGFIPNLDTLKWMVFGSVQVWRQFVTASTPLGSFFGFALVPFMIALLGSVTAMTAVWRAKRAQLSLVPIVVTLMFVIALGTSQPFFPVVQTLVGVVLALVWLNWRARHARINVETAQKSSISSLVHWRGVGILLGVTAVATALATPYVSATFDRDVIRSHVVPPLDMQQYPSPLISFRPLVDDKADTELFTVTGWQSAPGYRLRLAVMDDFDGMVYNVGSASGSSRYDRVGTELGSPGRRTFEGTPAQLHIEVQEYSGVWVPDLSAMTSAAFLGPRSDALTQGLYYNPVSDALVDTAGLWPGDAYEISAVIASIEPDVTTSVASARLPEPQWVPESVPDLATRWASGESTVFGQISAIVHSLNSTGFFSHGLETQEPSKPGHSAARIAEMLTDPDRMVGDDEQYAVACALMLRELGIPARVVMGFYPDDQSDIDADVWTVTGSDTHAWVEVPFDGVGWFAFFPTPDKNQVPQQETQQSKSKPKPQVLQPPPPANGQEDEMTKGGDPNREDEEEEKDDTAFPWGLVLSISAAIVLPLVLLFGPALVIVGLKKRRSSTRQKENDILQRVAGGWQEVLDKAVDMGIVMPKSATRREASRILEKRWGIGPLTPLAQEADRSCFGSVSPTTEEADNYWKKVHQVSDQVSGKLSRWQRIKSRLSLRSLLPNPQPTVDMEALE
ncbi:MAG: transglutaminase-like domain-containing protein [Propionibacteriaceae bacterium]|nr:transglutaminase-like domain-containing protein [Propionibacteriaceae bacterium]